MRGAHSLRLTGDIQMLDIVMIALVAISFALLAGYGALCDRL